MKKQEFIKLNCAPSRNGLSEFTCYKSNEILKMKENWNNRHPDVKIVSDDIKEIWEELKNNMEETCNNEACWLRQKFMENENNNELMQYTFAPKAPKSWLKNPNEWLSSLDINKIMKQYEHDFPNFDFIGPSPIDFDTFLSAENKCVWEELCHFSLKKHLSKGKQKIGIIFNTDKHNQGGSHWISLFINIEKGKNFTPKALIQYYHAMIARPDRTTVLKTFENPILFIIGKFDNAVPLQSSLEQCYLPAIAHVNILTESAHMGMLEETEKVNQIILQFLS